MEQAFINELKGLKNVIKKNNNKPNPKKGKSRKNKKPNNKNDFNRFPTGNSQKSGFNKGTDTKVITKREHIADIASSIAFFSQQFAVNPGQAGTFPWLHTESLQWEKYVFKKLKFILKPLVTQFTNNGVGKIILGFDSDASDPGPTNKQEAENIKPVADGMPYQTLELVIPQHILAAKHDAWFVRGGHLPGNSDIKTYDIGNLFVSTQGQATIAPNISELWAEYTIEFLIPAQVDLGAPPQNNSITEYYSAGTYEGPYPENIPFRVQMTQKVADGIGIPNDGTGIFTLPAGNFIILHEGTIKSANTASSMNAITYAQVWYQPIDGAPEIVNSTAFIPTTPGLTNNIWSFPLAMTVFLDASAGDKVWIQAQMGTNTIGDTIYYDGQLIFMAV